MTIRVATKEDLPAVLALYAQPMIDDDRMLSAAEAARISDRISSYPGYAIYVAESDGTIIGTFALLIMDNLVHLGRPSGIVEAVAVHPQWQRRRFGTRLMKEAMDLCRRAGCYKMTLSAGLKRSGAHQFYDSLGFRRHGYSFLVET